MAGVINKLVGDIVPDWSFGPGSSPTTGAFVTGAGCVSLAMVGACIGRSIGSMGHAALAVGVLGLAITAYAAASAAYHEQPARVIGYRAGCWLAGTTWAAVTVAFADPKHLVGSGPWSMMAILILSCGLLVAASVGKWLSRVQLREEIDALPEFADVDLGLDKEDKIARVWGDLIRRVTRIPGLKVVGVELWESSRGFTLDMDLPATGITMMDVKRHELAIATAARLKEGCNVEVTKSDVGRGSFLVKVSTSNALIESYPMPVDYSPMSIMNPISLGVKADGEEKSITVQYKTSVMIGQKDSGKSTMLNAMMSSVTRSVDAIIIGIDTTGRGRAFRPWVRAWHEGRATRPCIDLVAGTDEMAIATCRGVRNVIAGRTAAYHERMYRENSDKIIPAADLPSIIVIVDEYGTLPEAVKDALVDLSDTGRGASVSVVVCALRAQSSYLSRNMITQAYNRIAMRVTDETELQYLFDSTWSRGRFDPASMPYAGVGLAAEGASLADGFKGWWQSPSEVDALTIAVAGRRPPLDAISEQLMDAPEGMGGLYARRWELTLPLMFPKAGEVISTAPAAKTHISGGVATVTQEKVGSLEETQAGMDRAVARIKAAAAAADAECAAEAENGDPRSAEIALLEALVALPPTEAQERMRQMLKTFGERGAGASQLAELLKAEGYSTARQTVVTWLQKDLAAGLVVQPGGDRKPYIWRGEQ